MMNAEADKVAVVERGPLDTEEFVHGTTEHVLIPDEHGLIVGDRPVGGVPDGSISVAAGGAGGAPCAYNVTKLDDGFVLREPTVVLMWWSGFFWELNAPQRRYIVEVKSQDVV